MGNLVRVSLLALGLGLVLGCGRPVDPPPVGAPDQPRGGGVYRRAFSDGFMVLDPGLVKDSFSHEVCRQIFEGLVEFDVETRVIPALAERWEISPDRLQYTFHLRPDARFHDTVGEPPRPTRNGGRSVTAADVAFTFNRLLDPTVPGRRGQAFLVIKGAQTYRDRLTAGSATVVLPPPGESLVTGASQGIEGIEVLGSHTVRFTLEKPFAPFISQLALSNAFIVPIEDALATEIPLASEPVGAGPFVWAGRNGETMRLRANERYYQGRPFLDRVEFPVIPDGIDRFKAFMRGELDHVDVPDQEYVNIKHDPKWSKLFQETSRWGTYYLGFNVRQFPFDQLKVRQAINEAVDREAIVKLILNDRARVAKGVLPPGITAFNPNLRGYSYDLAKARELLAEAGFPNGQGLPPITLQFNQDHVHERTSELIQANLRDLGIDCQVRVVDFQEHLRTVESGEAGFFRMGWTCDYPDPDNFLYTLFHSENRGAGGNFSGYANERVDHLLERARFEVDPKDRIPLYQQAEQLIVDDAPWVFVYHYTTHLLAQPYVHGIVMTPMGSPFIRYRTIHLSKPAGPPAP
jgi:oligopeptide transport system substrate-binding protein